MIKEEKTVKLATAAQMKELDRQAIENRGISSIDLMERAAEGVAKAHCCCADAVYERCPCTCVSGRKL